MQVHDSSFESESIFLRNCRFERNFGLFFWGKLQERNPLVGCGIYLDLWAFVLPTHSYKNLNFPKILEFLFAIFDFSGVKSSEIRK